MQEEETMIDGLEQVTTDVAQVDEAPLSDDVSRLQQEVDALRQELEELRQEFRDHREDVRAHHAKRPALDLEPIPPRPHRPPGVPEYDYYIMLREGETPEEGFHRARRERREYEENPELARTRAIANRFFSTDGR